MDARSWSRTVEVEGGTVEVAIAEGLSIVSPEWAELLLDVVEGDLRHGRIVAGPGDTVTFKGPLLLR